jgi:hypothetical protein
MNIVPSHAALSSDTANGKAAQLEVNTDTKDFLFILETVP